jgi:hypothetical protein
VVAELRRPFRCTPQPGADARRHPGREGALVE